MSFTLGSLFDGSGGFPLAATMCGGTPLWASEVEPFPIAVTWSRFPGMKHLGSVTDINGAEIDPVDVITFGSPCQDLSVAGKRAGLKHAENGDEETTRSGLFMEAIRIIKEMRKATNGEFPKYCCWENVPGAFSSNGGRDFRTVLEELIKIVEPSAVMPPVPKNGWPYADSYCGEGWSLSYRTFDAQYWGVPQRRRRIYLCIQLVPNLGDGSRAEEILFKHTGLRGYFAEGRTPWQGAAAQTQDCVGVHDREPNGERGGGGADRGVAYTLKIRSGCEGGGKGALIQENLSATLATNNDQYLFVPVAYGFDQGATRDVGKLFLEEQSKTLTNGSCPGHHNGVVIEQLVLDDQGGSQISVRTDGKSPTLRAEMHGNVPCVLEPKTFDARGNGDGDVASTITGDHESRITDYTSVVVEPICLEGNGSRPSHKGNGWSETDTMYTLNATEQHAVCLPIADQATRFAGKRGDKADGKGNGLGVGNPGDPMYTITGGDRHAVAYCTDVGWLNSVENKSPTLLARQYKDPHLVCCPAAVQARYIVRRLTPTECARLQGFADRWATPIRKDDFTEEEYQFWLKVRNTHAAINGKAVKDYTKAQMLTYYNKLPNDGNEYKLWGNGIALPNALFVIMGIAEVLNKINRRS